MIPAIQNDRDAAHKLLCYRGESEAYTKAILAGCCDEGDAVQSFAMHREQAIIPLVRVLTAMVALAERMGMDVWDTSALSEEGVALAEARRVLDECK